MIFMDEIKEMEKYIFKLKREHKYKEIYAPAKLLYESENASDQMGIIYGQALVFNDEKEEANRIFEKYYMDNSKNTELLLNLFHIAFEKCDFEGAYAYLEELKPLINKKFI